MSRFVRMAKIAVAVSAAAGLLLADSAMADRKVPIDFNDYHGYTGTVQYLRDVARAYPGITELLEIGKSTSGRSIYVLVVTNRKTGTAVDAFIHLNQIRDKDVKNILPMKPYLGKPGFWIDGALHGNEYTGTEVCLYIIDRLVSGYGEDSGITILVDEKTFYFCPALNPDGLFNSVEKGIPQRRNSMEIDDDGDGKINEDGPDDLNGDGFYTQFRYRDPEGRYIIDDFDPRMMIRIDRDQKTDKQRYSVIMEDRDNDGDGKRGEDGEEGIDLNRNFPEGWYKSDGSPGGTGDHPTSAPETKALAEFFARHGNIYMAQNFHTTGGFTYRPLATTTDDAMDLYDIAVYDQIMGKKYLELIGDPVPEAWSRPEEMEKFREVLRAGNADSFAVRRGYIMPRGWVYNRDGVLAFGVILDWMHKHFGFYAITTELWNPAKDIPGAPEFPEEDYRTRVGRFLLKYQDENYKGRYFIPWQKFLHPELGEGEIGGWIPQYSGGNNALPGAPLLYVCDLHWRFERFRAGLMPRVVISDVSAEIQKADRTPLGPRAEQQAGLNIPSRGESGENIRVVEVTAKIVNLGPLATHSRAGRSVPGNREDEVWLLGESDKITYLQGDPYQKIGVLSGRLEIPGFHGRRETRPEGQDSAVILEGSTCTVKWVIELIGEPELKVVSISQKGGTEVKTLQIKD